MRIVVAAMLVGASTIAGAQDVGTAKQIAFESLIPYAEGAYIAENVKSECNLQTVSADFLRSALKSRGFEVVEAGATQDAIPRLKVQIASASSSGNAFIGHHKGMAITGELQRDGQVVASFEAFRTSGGGVMGGFKGSCGVLARCAKALAEDIARWVESPTMKAKLGNAR